MTRSIWPVDWSSRKSAAPVNDPNSPPTIITPPIFRSTPPRRMWTITPDTLAPVIWDAAEEAERHHEQRVDRLAGDRKVDVHCGPAGLAGTAFMAKRVRIRPSSGELVILWRGADDGLSRTRADSLPSPLRYARRADRFRRSTYSSLAGPD